MTPAATEDKTVAIVSYLTLIGFLVGVVLHSSKKTKLGAFHLRQTLGLFITGFVGGFLWIIPILGWIAGFALWICLLVMWVIGFIGAIKGEMKTVPILGEKYQQWFGNAFE